MLILFNHNMDIPKDILLVIFNFLSITGKRFLLRTCTTNYNQLNKYISLEESEFITIINRIALGGHLEALKWAHSNGCYWNEYTCSYAARNGHLEVLKWARDHGCHWNEYTCRHAAMNGHLEVLKWARDNGCNWNENTC